MMNRAVWIASRRLARAPTVTSRCLGTQIYDSGSVTYSGGQATDGQGGYYGSGGARKKMTEEPHRPELLAMQTDVQHVADIMNQVADLEETLSDDVNKSMEARATIKKVLTSADFMETLERLECVKGEPVWGLSQQERELITAARIKVNQC